MAISLVSSKTGRSNLADVERGAPAATDSSDEEVETKRPPWSNLADVERGAPAATDSSDEEVETKRPPWMRVLHRVPPPLREKNKEAYDPSIVSLGPYHHGQPQFREFEEFKDELVDITLKEDHQRQLFRSNILERIEDIRHFYGGLSRDEYGDEALAEMMLRDACVVLCFVEMTAANEEVQENCKEKAKFLFRRLGLFRLQLMGVDVVCKLENQIPWWLINSLIKSAYDGDEKEEGEALLLRFFSSLITGDLTKLKQLPLNPVRDEYCPLHLLEAFRITTLQDPKFNETETNTTTLKCCKWRKKKSYAAAEAAGRRRPFRSVKELKAKGIHFKPSSYFLLDISFESYYFFGVLHLPVLAVSKDDRILYSNLVALEMSPATPGADMNMTSYLALMKSMIHDSEDVKALQEKGIILNFAADSEDVVRIFKEIDSHGVDTFHVFEEMKMRIDEHCNNRSKTWIAELINTNFRSPWTVIALFAAGFLLCLTFLQTYYTVNPKK